MGRYPTFWRYDACVSASTSLVTKTFFGLAQLEVIMALLIFLPAWSIHYWQGWGFLITCSLGNWLITIYFLRRDPALIERRSKGGPRAEKQERQKMIMVAATFSIIGLVVVSSLDHGLGWSYVPLWVSVFGDAMVATGFSLIFLVFKANTFASATIEVGQGQRVITTGPYGLVRHPMYAGALPLVVGVPLALGSWWGLLFSVAMVAVLVWRLNEEEKFLVQNLPGYIEYRSATAYRLIPKIY